MEEVTTLFDSNEAEYEYMKEQEARRLKAEEEKQIEEMARQNCHIEYHMKNYKTCKECYETNYCACRVYEVCRNLYNAGYRKQSEVVAEIFEEIKEQLRGIFDFFRQDNDIRESCAIMFAISEVDKIEKKYTGATDTNDGHKNEEEAPHG